MSRFALALCALFVVTTPWVALSNPTIPDGFERPEAHRHAINAVIGDLSFIDRYGIPPPPGTDADLRVRTHLEFVHALLSQRDVSDLPTDLREARRRNLAWLREYIDAGRYPRNYLYADQNRPCFIDREGRICAAGYLVEQSAGREVAERVNEAFQSEFLWKMELPELDRWIAGSGFSLLELCMIQPGYSPVFNVQITQDSDRAPATVTVRGYVYDESVMPCDTKHLIFDFGDGAMWKSHEANAWIVWVDIAHIYTTPGTYTITGIAVAEDACGNKTGTDTWEITLTAPVFTLRVAQATDGPLHTVYLRTTDDIRMDYLSAATVAWGDGGSPEDCGWYRDGDAYRTPVHAYATRGRRKIAVTHRYEGSKDTFSEVSSVSVEVGAAPEEPSSWGRIKALFASGG